MGRAAWAAGAIIASATAVAIFFSMKSTFRFSTHPRSSKMRAICGRRQIAAVQQRVAKSAWKLLKIQSVSYSDTPAVAAR
jgi:hypothetical protein